jgi:hypothetical protein
MSDEKVPVHLTLDQIAKLERAAYDFGDFTLAKAMLDHLESGKRLLALRATQDAAQAETAQVQSLRNAGSAAANKYATDAVENAHWARTDHSLAMVAGGIVFHAYRVRNRTEAERLLPTGMDGRGCAGYVVRAVRDDTAQQVYVGVARNLKEATEQVRCAIFRVTKRRHAQQHGYAPDARWTLSAR